MVQTCKPVSKSWRKLLCSLPGYDPFAQANGCWFNPKAAQRAIDFIQLLKHVEGEKAGHLFLLERWQRAFVANLFGWMKTDDHGRAVRRYREALLYVPRKNGKTPLAAAILNYVLFSDSPTEAGAQIYGAAASREQAGYLFRHAKGMVMRNAAMNKAARVYDAHKSIVLLRDPASSYVVLSADGYTKHGGNSHLVIIDELHAQPNRELTDTLKTSFASANRKQPLMLYITTADWMRESICNEVYHQACKVRDNDGDQAKEGFDPSFLPAIWETAKDEDWTLEETWRKANPNLGVSVSLDYLRRECQIAQEIPAKENGFRRLHLNQRTESDVRAIPAALWNGCCTTTDPVGWRRDALERLRGRRCVAGLDLASVNDLVAYVLVFDETLPMTVVPFFWATEESVERRRKAMVPYDAWLTQGFLSVAGISAIDYDPIRKDILELQSKYPLRSADHMGKEFIGRYLLAVDYKFQGLAICNDLEKSGLPTVRHGQGPRDMVMPAKRLLEMLAAKQLDHGANPILAWHAGNATFHSDGDGNQCFNKKKSGDKIDGIIALTMAISGAETAPTASAIMIEAW